MATDESTERLTETTSQNQAPKNAPGTGAVSASSAAKADADANADANADCPPKDEATKPPPPTGNSPEFDAAFQAGVQKFFSHKEFQKYTMAKLRRFGIYKLSTDLSYKNKDTTTTASSSDFPLRYMLYICGTCDPKDRRIPTTAPNCCGFSLKVKLIAKKKKNIKDEKSQHVPYLLVEEAKLPLNSRHNNNNNNSNSGENNHNNNLRPLTKNDFDDDDSTHKKPHPQDFNTEFPLHSQWPTTDSFKNDATNRLHKYGIHRLVTWKSASNKDPNTNSQFPILFTSFHCATCNVRVRHSIPSEDSGCCGLYFRLNLVTEPRGNHDDYYNEGFEPHYSLVAAKLPPHSRHFMSDEEYEELVALEKESHDKRRKRKSEEGADDVKINATVQGTTDETNEVAQKPDTNDGEEEEEEGKGDDEEEKGPPPVAVNQASQELLTTMFPKNSKWYSLESFKEYALSRLKVFGIHSFNNYNTRTNDDALTQSQFPLLNARFTCKTCSRSTKQMPITMPMCCGFRIRVKLIRKSKDLDPGFIPHLILTECILPPTSKHLLMTPAELAEEWENREIYKESDLTKLQLNVLRALGAEEKTAAEIKEIMKQEFPGLNIANQLLTRIAAEGRKQAQWECNQGIINAFDLIASFPCEMGIGDIRDDHEDFEDVFQENPVNCFFQNIWQRQPAIYRGTDLVTSLNNGVDEEVSSLPLSKVISMGWDDVADLLHHCRQKMSCDAASGRKNDTSDLQFYQNGNAITDPDAIYSYNPHAAYLDGCSVAVNHADFHCKAIAELCKSLQRTFPHVYANACLIPPNVFAMKAHADDYDKLVIQVLGQNLWKICKNVPVELPLDDRKQLGKKESKMDKSVLEGGLCFEDSVLSLSPGDILYIPRGFVHKSITIDDTQESEEETNPPSEYQPSFHITIVLPTKEWCLSKVLGDRICEALNGVTDFRKSLPIGPCEEYEWLQGDNIHEPASSATYLQHQMNHAISVIREKVTASSLEEGLRMKYLLDNARAEEHRSTIGQQSRKRKFEETHLALANAPVGPSASSKVKLGSTIRGSTPAERESITSRGGQSHVLTLREETDAILMRMLGRLKNDPISLSKNVRDMRSLVNVDKESSLQRYDKSGLALVCDFTLLSFARCCIEMGAIALVDE